MTKTVTNLKKNASNEDEMNETDLVLVSAEIAPTEIAHPHDSCKKVVSFEILSPMGAQHIGFALGPFVETPLPDFKEIEVRDMDDLEERRHICPYQYLWIPRSHCGSAKHLHFCQQGCRVLFARLWVIPVSVAFVFFC